MSSETTTWQQQILEILAPLLDTGDSRSADDLAVSIYAIIATSGPDAGDIAISAAIRKLLRGKRLRVISGEHIKDTSLPMYEISFGTVFGESAIFTVNEPPADDRWELTEAGRAMRGGE